MGRTCRALTTPSHVCVTMRAKLLQHFRKRQPLIKDNSGSTLNQLHHWHPGAALPPWTFLGKRGAPIGLHPSHAVLEGHPAPAVNGHNSFLAIDDDLAGKGDVAEVAQFAITVRFFLSNVPMSITGGTDVVMRKLMRFEVRKKANQFSQIVLGTRVLCRS